jgi:hypothetical protein
MDFHLVHDFHYVCVNCEESFVDSLIRLVVVFVYDESNPIIELVVFHGVVGVRLGDLLWV